MRTGNMAIFADAEGDTVLVRCRCGGKKEEFRAMEYDTPDEMTQVIANWFHRYKAAKVKITEAKLSVANQLVEVIRQQQAFNTVILAVADEIDRTDATTWDGLFLDKSIGYGASPSKVDALVDRIKAEFDPQNFLVLARMPDDSEWNGTGPLNPGLNKIKDVIFGNERNDRTLIINVEDE